MMILLMRIIFFFFTELLIPFAAYLPSFFLKAVQVFIPFSGSFALLLPACLEYPSYIMRKGLSSVFFTFVCIIMACSSSRLARQVMVLAKTT
jgi:hypothetical protein